jgi:hypothetical protein
MALRAIVGDRIDRVDRLRSFGARAIPSSSLASSSPVSMALNTELYLRPHLCPAMSG